MRKNKFMYVISSLNLLKTVIKVSRQSTINNKLIKIIVNKGCEISFYVWDKMVVKDV